MSTTKKCQVILLPTEKAISINQICLLKEGKLHISTGGIGDLSCNRYHYQHLYFLSDDEIKDGDWFIEFDLKGTRSSYCNKPFLCDVGNTGNFILTKNSGNFPFPEHCKKIIATTDSSLFPKEQQHIVQVPLHERIPQAPEDFLRIYVEEYNKGNQIEWVDVEYEDATEYDRVYNNEKYFPRLKVNSKNEISIKKIKDTWTRDEVIALLHNMPFDIDLHYGQGIFNKWIGENL